jgi:polar amino acid transport system substrate-binding protein
MGVFRTRLGVLATMLPVVLSACRGDTTATQGPDLDLVVDGTLTVCADVPHEPFLLEAPDAPSGFGGFDIDLVQAVADDLALDLQVRETRFDRIVDASAMHAGRCDLGASAIAIVDAWQADLDFTEPYYEVRQSLLVPAGSDLTALGDTQGARIGVQTGTAGQSYAEEHAPAAAEIVGFATSDELFVAVATDEADAALHDLAVNAPRSRADASVEVVETFPTGEHYGFAVASGREDGLLDAVQGSLDRLVDDGTYAEIHDRYFAP